jgi:hypothetical protein
MELKNLKKKKIKKKLKKKKVEKNLKRMTTFEEKFPI